MASPGISRDFSTGIKCFWKEKMVVISLLSSAFRKRPISRFIMEFNIIYIQNTVSNYKRGLELTFDYLGKRVLKTARDQGTLIA